jgi:8-oxo-dGTP pyrophosphatase MutT (NUDIX family)
VRFPVSIKGVVLAPGVQGGTWRVALLENERREWELPGGKLEPGESPEACLVREIQEELDLRVAAGPLLDVWVYRVRPDIPETDVLIVTYGCLVEPFDEIRPTAEHRTGRLVPLDELTQMPMPAGYRRSICAWAAEFSGVAS